MLIVITVLAGVIVFLFGVILWQRAMIAQLKEERFWKKVVERTVDNES